jgi:hypothetical protein
MKSFSTSTRHSKRKSLGKLRLQGISRRLREEQSATVQAEKNSDSGLDEIDAAKYFIAHHSSTLHLTNTRDISTPNSPAMHAAYSSQDDISPCTLRNDSNFKAVDIIDLDDEDDEDALLEASQDMYVRPTKIFRSSFYTTEDSGMYPFSYPRITVGSFHDEIEPLHFEEYMTDSTPELPHRMSLQPSVAAVDLSMSSTSYVPTMAAVQPSVSMSSSIPFSDSQIDNDKSSSLVSVEIAQMLDELGLHQHLIFAVQRQEAHMKTVITRFANFMEWLIDTQPFYKACTADTLQLHVKRFIVEDYDLLIAYVHYLTDQRHFQASTVTAHLDDLRLVVTWFCLFRTINVMNESKVKQPEMLGFITTVKQLRKILNRKVSYMI